jgi:uncharacterized protein YpmB
MAEKKTDIVKTILSIIIVILGIFGVTYYLKSDKESKARIEAQNEIARLSEVVTENETTFSRLSQQSDDIITALTAKNEELATIITSRDERILSLTETIANFEPTKIVVRQERITETVVVDGSNERVRLEFSEEEDPIRVSGVVLTNPSEIELAVGYMRPLRLQTVITQLADGSWRTYITGDWPNLRIENIDTTVNPRLSEPRSFLESLSLGTMVSTSVKLNSFLFGANILYDITDSVSVGPMFGVATVQDNSSVIFGLSAQWRMFN